MNRIRTETYSTMPKAVFLDKRISLEAKGLYALIMSLPSEGDMLIRDITEAIDANAVREEIEPYLNELLAFGYIHEAADEEGD